MTSRPRPRAILAASLALVMAAHGPAQARDDARKPRHHDAPQAAEWAPEFQPLDDDALRILPLKHAVELVKARFRGRLIAAAIVPPHPHERDRGVLLVHELRLLTQRRDVLVIRLDAHDGRFLEVAGAGLTEARKKGDDE